MHLLWSAHTSAHETKSEVAKLHVGQEGELALLAFPLFDSAELLILAPPSSEVALSATERMPHDPLSAELFLKTGNNVSLVRHCLSSSQRGIPLELASQVDPGVLGFVLLRSGECVVSMNPSEISEASAARAVALERASLSPDLKLELLLAFASHVTFSSTAPPGAQFMAGPDATFAAFQAEAGDAATKRYTIYTILSPFVPRYAAIGVSDRLLTSLM